MVKSETVEEITSKSQQHRPSLSRSLWDVWGWNSDGNYYCLSYDFRGVLVRCCWATGFIMRQNLAHLTRLYWYLSHHMMETPSHPTWNRWVTKQLTCHQWGGPCDRSPFPYLDGERPKLSRLSYNLCFLPYGCGDKGWWSRPPSTHCIGALVVVVSVWCNEKQSSKVCFNDLDSWHNIQQAEPAACVRTHWVERSAEMIFS